MAMTVAGFTGGEAEELRRAMGFKRSEARMRQIEARLRAGMARNGLVGETADAVVRSITSFALYGFPESHAASFALIVYASAYLKAYYPAAFYAALLDNQPMGFYHPATLVKDAQRHGVRFAPIDVQASDWACRVEPDGSIRLGLRYVRGLREEVARAIERVAVIDEKGRIAAADPSAADGDARTGVGSDEGERARAAAGTNPGVPAAGRAAGTGEVEPRCPRCGTNDGPLLEVVAQTLAGVRRFCSVCAQEWVEPRERAQRADRERVVGHPELLPTFGGRPGEGVDAPRPPSALQMQGPRGALARAGRGESLGEMFGGGRVGASGTGAMGPANQLSRSDDGPGGGDAPAAHRRFRSLEHLIAVTGVRRDELATLAEIGALNGFGYDRRSALWQIERAVRPAGALFEEREAYEERNDRDGREAWREAETSALAAVGLTANDPGAGPATDADTGPVTDTGAGRDVEAGERAEERTAGRTESATSWRQSPLLPMSPVERVVADYAGTGLTIGPHPMALRRRELALRGVLRATDLPAARTGRRVRVAGAVITRQRPGTAKGFVFLTLEDETGIANVIVRPDVFTEQRLVIVHEPFVIVEGVLQQQDGVTSVRAERVLPLAGRTPAVESHDFH
jgi:hypothetical protein